MIHLLLLLASAAAFSGAAASVRCRFRCWRKHDCVNVVIGLLKCSRSSVESRLIQLTLCYLLLETCDLSLHAGTRGLQFLDCGSYQSNVLSGVRCLFFDSV